MVNQYSIFCQVSGESCHRCNGDEEVMGHLLVEGGVGVDVLALELRVQKLDFLEEAVRFWAFRSQVSEDKQAGPVSVVGVVVGEV